MHTAVSLCFACVARELVTSRRDEPLGSGGNCHRASADPLRDGRGMDLGVVFSQADSGTDPNAIRAWVQTAEAEGFDHVMAYDHILGASLERLGPGPFGNFPGQPYTAENTGTAPSK